MTARALASALVLLVLPVAVWAAQRPATGTDEVNLTATSANVSQPGSPIRVHLFRWSTDEERTPVLAALNLPPPVAPPAGAPAAAAGAAARGGRAAAAGRGGRGARGGAGVPLTPAAALAAALGRSPTLGYVWTNDITGYSIKYAYHAPVPDGGARIILVTDRRLGAHTTAWRPASEAPVTDYEFTVIEIRLDARGVGEGKTSLTTNVIVDNEARTLALANYAATPAILQNVTRKQ